MTAPTGQPSLWKGTPVPEIDDPIDPTPALEAIAARIWWHGPPAIALRNANAFVWQVIDYADDIDVDTAYREIGRKRWTRAIRAARPGQVSRGAVLLWRTLLGLPTEDVRRTWPRDRHRNDIKVFANEPRERMYERHRIAHERTVQEGHTPPAE